MTTVGSSYLYVYVMMVQVLAVAGKTLGDVKKKEKKKGNEGIRTQSGTKQFLFLTQEMIAQHVSCPLKSRSLSGVVLKHTSSLFMPVHTAFPYSNIPVDFFLSADYKYIV